MYPLFFTVVAIDLASIKIVATNCPSEILLPSLPLKFLVTCLIEIWLFEGTSVTPKQGPQIVGLIVTPLSIKSLATPDLIIF